MNFADVLRRYRVEKGLSMGEVARRSGLSVSIISYYESGKRHPSRKAAARLVRALGLSPGETVEFMAAAGYGPPEPLLGGIGVLLEDERVPSETKEYVRRLLWLILELLEEAIEHPDTLETAVDWRAVQELLRGTATPAALIAPRAHG